MVADEIAAARAKLRALKRELADEFAEAGRQKSALQLLEDMDSSYFGRDQLEAMHLGRDVTSVLKIVDALEQRNRQSSSWRTQTEQPLSEAICSFQDAVHRNKATLETLEELRAERELRVVELQRHKQDLDTFRSNAEIRGPTSKDILAAIQTAVKNDQGSDFPLSLSIFANALRSDERIAQFLHANSQDQKEGAIEAVDALNRALGNPEGPVSQSIVLDLFFNPEAETEKLLTDMQKGPKRRPTWKLDHKSLEIAVSTLEASLQSKLKIYNSQYAATAEKLSVVRSELAEKEAEEKQEMELVAAFSAAQRERNAVKLQQKKVLERNRFLRKKAPSEAVAALNKVMGTNLSSCSQLSVLTVE